MPRHLSLAELTEGLPHILAAPKEQGTLSAIVSRPAKGKRRDLDSVGVSLAGGVEGDRTCRSA